MGRCHGGPGTGERFKGAFHAGGDDYDCCGAGLAEAHKIRDEVLA